MAKREKSAQYPKVTWNESMDFVKTVSSFSLSAVSYSEVAKKYGLSSPTAKSFTARLSTCKQFGLIETSGGNTIYLTDTCRRLLFPTGEDIRPVIKSCFNMPNVYNQLIARYDGKALPTCDVLSNIMMAEFEILPTVKESAAKAFLESLDQLSLLKGGILCFAGDNETINESVETAGAGTISSMKENPLENGNPAVKAATADADFITQKIPFESGKVAQFYIPIDATEDDLLLMRDMLDVILKRKFKLSE